MTVYAFPYKTKNNRNPYFDLLYSHIIRQDPAIKIEQGNFLKILFTSQKEKNVIHLHWATRLYGSKFFIISVLKLIINFSLFFIYKIKGIKIIWTMHNYESHDFKYPLIDKWGRKLIANIADSIIVHTKAGQNYLIDKLRRSKNIFIIPIGNYYGFYGEIIKNRDEKRKESGYKDSEIVFFNFGLMRPYKGVEKLIEIFNNFSKIDFLKLLVTGQFYSNEYFKRIRELNKNPNVLIKNEFISDKEMVLNIAIADFSIFTFKEILTSSAIILSLSYGLPVIAPQIGDIGEIIKDGENGFLFNNENELEVIILKIKNFSQKQKEEMRENALKSAQKLDWVEIAQKTIEIYKI